MEDEISQSSQEKWLADAKAAVAQQSFYLNRAIDEDNLRDVFKYSSALLGELRTSLLSPQKYYELYLSVSTTLLRQLEMFFEEQRGKGHTAAELYELVQHAGNVLPRLYLLVTVGAVFIRSHESPVKSLLKDLVEMCCGIQHPVRGLFLRTYLTQVSKEGLRLIEDGVDDGSSTVGDAVEFVLQNFTEMNKLWVRMKHQGPVRERAKRERERRELRDLVGKNLVILSSMEGVDERMYGEIVLPRIIEQVVNCKDELAQNYLMDCVIQVFPDEFHIKNLETFLGTLRDLAISGEEVLFGLCDRLARFVEGSAANAELFESVGGFRELLKGCEAAAAKGDQNAVAKIYSAVLDFAVSLGNQGGDGLDEGSLERVDLVLGECKKSLLLAEDGAAAAKVLSPSASRTLKSIITKPLDIYSITDLLGGSCGSLPALMQLLSSSMQKQVAVDIVEKLLNKGTVISDLKKVESLFDFIGTIIASGGGSNDDDEDEDEDEEDIEEEQNLVARLVHQMRSPSDLDTTFEILRLCKDRFQQGGPLRLKHTLPTVVFDVLQLVKQCEDKEKCKEMLQFMHGTIDLVAEVPQPEKAFKLYLECTLVADLKGLEDSAYDFMTAAFDIYENSIPDTKAQVEALAMLIGTLNECENFGEDNWDTLITSATKWSIKLLKKSDQCRAVYSCSHLFWGKNEDGSIKETSEKVLVCLKRALTIAKQAQGMGKSSRGDVGPVELFIAILNRYLYFFDQQQEDSGVQVIKAEDIQNLLDLVSNETSNEKEGGGADTLKFYHNTLRYIMHLKEKSPEKYAGISLKN